MKAVTAARMRALDREAIERRGIPAGALMEAAGRAIAEEIAAQFPEPGHCVVLAGRGNNGGDGLVAARHLAHSGWRVDLVAVMGLGFAGPALDAWRALPADVAVHEPAAMPNLPQLLADADAVLDAMLGTGASGELRAPLGDIVDCVNNCPAFVAAADIPTGLDADTGRGPRAIRAHRTVAIGLPKVGFLVNDGPSLTGTVVVRPIQFPADLLACPDVRTATLTRDEARALLPRRPRDGHKGTFGLCALFAGSDSMPGAASLAAQGALRSGCGLVRAVAPGAIRPILAAQIPEALLPALPSLAGEPSFRALPPQEWELAGPDADAAVIGPGLGTGVGCRDLLFQALERLVCPVVLDADALNIAAAEPDIRALLGEAHVLTPHPGEMARLLGRSVAEVQRDRWQSAMDAADRFGCVVAFKGHGTIVADPGGEATHIPTGNTALARGGSGDVLAGLIGGLLAQRCAPGAAARLGCWIHGLAADIAARGASPRGLRVTDIAAAIPHAFAETELPSGTERG
ncbi:MAG: NAD(P)H-hydrate dehydratase [Candidatus Sumerlaeia bacterium]|nr:NAD(P)H-hydrate dehydratase [Candidatus Sumerlaeia bacterium]